MALDENGFTVFEESIDTRKVYVSSSEGDDGNDGLTELTPKATLAAGMSLVRNDYPDWLLLKRGDEWEESLHISNRRGKNAEEPMLFGAYGDGPRPLLRNNRIYTIAGSGRTLYFVAIVGIDVYYSRCDPNSPDFDPEIPGASGLSLSTEGTDILVEDCVFRFSTGNTIQGFSNTGSPGRIDRVSVRRNVIVDSYSVGSHSAGIFFSNVDNLVLEDNYISNNGWNDVVPGAGATVFNHNVYIQTTVHGCHVRGNVSARASSHAFHWRSGGTIEDNLIYQCPIGIDVNVSDLYTADTVVRRNTILAPSDFSGLVNRGWGIEIKPALYGLYEENVIADKESSSGNAAVMIEDYLMTDKFFNNGENPLPPGSKGDVTIRNNYVRNCPSTVPRVIYGTFRMPIKPEAVGYYTIEGHTIDGKDKAGNPVDMVDGARNLNGYMTAFGSGGGFAALDTLHRTRGPGEWDETWSAEAISSWVRAGFQAKVDPIVDDYEHRFRHIENQQEHLQAAVNVLNERMQMVSDVLGGG